MDRDIDLPHERYQTTKQEDPGFFRDGVRFMLSVFHMRDLPSPDVPEIAFAGASNVGKSSLLNALTDHKGLAKTSNTPGRTQCLNFFDVRGECRLVDLPGYGYAKAPKNLAKQWQRLIVDFLKGRPNLQRVCLLVDARHDLKKNDVVAMQLLDELAVPYVVVMTKIDQIKPIDLPQKQRTIESLLIDHPAAFPHVFATSVLSKSGLGELVHILACEIKNLRGI